MMEDVIQLLRACVLPLHKESDRGNVKAFLAMHAVRVALHHLGDDDGSEDSK